MVNKITISTIILTTCVGFMLGLGNYIDFYIITPAIFLVGEVLLMAAVGLANTPVLKGGAMLLFASWLFVFFLGVNIPLASPYKEFIYAVLFVPSFIGVGMEMLEIGKG